MKSRKRRFRQNTSEDDSKKENDELRLCLTIAPDEDKEVDYEILDKKDDLNVVYQLVMDRYQDEIPEGFDRVLWGDLMIMFNQMMKIRTLHMLVEKKYPIERKFVKKQVAELEPNDSDGDEENL
ncbi:hypothetical protein Tco_1304079 [Tanacetum coccineum]